MRVRSTLAATVVVGVALLAAALAGWSLLHHSLDRAARDDVVARTATVGLEVARDGVNEAELAERPLFGEVVQVVGEDGAVLVAAPPSAGHLRLLQSRPELGRTTVRRIPALPQSGADEPYVVATTAVRAGHGGQVVFVIVGRSVAGFSETVGLVGRLAGVGLPALVLVAAAATYVSTGRALAPVEDLRRQVSRISARRLDERVPVPPVRDEIHRLAETMNEMLGDLEASQVTMRRFVADAGHELRSPLATIGITIDVARAEHTVVGPAAQVLDDIEAETHRMGRLVADMLLLAQADEHALRLHAEDVDLDDVVESEAHRLRTLAADRLTVSARTVPVRLVGDRDRLAQALRNLTDNAVRYARHRIHLELTTGDAGVVLRVEDDGEGIPEPDRERVLDRFVRLDAARDRGSGGSGLGLSIVAEIVAGHGGTVTVGASPLGGAAFELSLPLSAAVTPAGRGGSPSPAR